MVTSCQGAVVSIQRLFINHSQWTSTKFTFLILAILSHPSIPCTWPHTLYPGSFCTRNQAMSTQVSMRPTPHNFSCKYIDTSLIILHKYIILSSLTLYLYSKLYISLYMSMHYSHLYFVSPRYLKSHQSHMKLKGKLTTMVNFTYPQPCNLAACSIVQA